MFDFRIIETSDGNQVIDRSLKTPKESLTPLQKLEYTEMEDQIYISDKLKEKARKETEQQERRQKRARNLLYRLASMCGMV